MRIGGYFPFRTERERFDLRINAGFFDDFGGNFRGTPSGGETSGGDSEADRSFFQSGPVIPIDERSFQSPGTTGGSINRDTEFRREKSRFDKSFGPIAGGLVGAGLGIPGLGSLFSRLAGSQSFRTDAQGNMIQGSFPNAQGNNIASFVNSPEGQAALQSLGGGNVPVTINEAGQLVDNSGALINQQGQRIDESGRVLSEADIAIQQALGFTQEAATGAAGEIRGGQESASGFLGGGAQSATEAARRAAIRGRDFLQGGETRGQQFLTGGEGRAQGFIQSQADQGISGIEQQLGITQARLDPFTQAGTRALGSEEAFLGQLGPEAQAAAFAGFTESPGQQFFREGQEQARVRQASALGGLGGGRVQIALQEDAFGRASTRLDDQLNRLSQLSGRGQQSATQQGQFGQQAAGNIANIRSQLGGRQAGLATDLAGRQAGLATGTATNLANIAGTLGGQEVGIQSGLGVNQANLATGTSANLADILVGQGTNQSQAVLGQQVARAGEQSQANQLAAQRDIADQQFQADLLGLGAQVFQKPISNFLGGLF